MISKIVIYELVAEKGNLFQGKLYLCMLKEHLLLLCFPRQITRVAVPSVVFRKFAQFISSYLFSRDLYLFLLTYFVCTQFCTALNKCPQFFLFYQKFVWILKYITQWFRDTMSSVVFPFGKQFTWNFNESQHQPNESDN